MKRLILFLYVMCMKWYALGIPMQIINNTGSTCNIIAQLNSFSCSIHLIDDQIISSNGQTKDITLEKGKSAMIFLTRTPSNSVANDQIIISVNGMYSFFGKRKILFPISLKHYKGVDIPVFSETKDDNDNSDLLRGTHGFYIRKYLSPRFDRYVLELLKS